MPTARGMSANGAMGADGPRSCTKRLYSTGTNGQSRELLFSDSQKRRFGLSSVPPLLGYSPEASGTATTGEMRPRKVGHWPLWRRQRFQRRARAICSHEWTPPGPVRIHPAELRSPLTSLPQKSLVHQGGLGGIGISAEVDFDELADFAVEVDFVVCRGVRITSATCRQGR